MALEYVDLSPAYLESLPDNPDIEVVSKERAMAFDANGNLEMF
jgi:hypothetical protein